MPKGTSGSFRAQEKRNVETDRRWGRFFKAAAVLTVFAVIGAFVFGPEGLVGGVALGALIAFCNNAINP